MLTKYLFIFAAHESEKVKKKNTDTVLNMIVWYYVSVFASEKPCMIKQHPKRTKHNGCLRKAHGTHVRASPCKNNFATLNKMGQINAAAFLCIAFKLPIPCSLLKVWPERGTACCSTAIWPRLHQKVEDAIPKSRSRAVSGRSSRRQGDDFPEAVSSKKTMRHHSSVIVSFT